MAKKAPVGSITWDEATAAELDDLRRLLFLVARLNNGNLFLDKVREAIEAAERLTRWRLSQQKPSFLVKLERSLAEAFEATREPTP